MCTRSRQQEWRQFKDVSLASAHRQLREGAVPEMGGGCHHLSWWHRHHVLQKSFSFAYIRCFPSPQLLLPILRGELDPPLTSVILGWGREVRSILQMPVELGDGTLLRHPGGRETWFPTVKGGVRLRSPQESIRTDGCVLCFLLCNRLHRSDNW